jgi:hypothetical protein
MVLFTEISSQRTYCLILKAIESYLTSDSLRKEYSLEKPQTLYLVEVKLIKYPRYFKKKVTELA